MQIGHANLRAAKSLAIVFAFIVCGAAGPQSDIGATGTIEPHGGLVLISGVVGATIKTVMVRVGQSVKKGDLLMTLVDDQQQVDAKVAANSLDEARRHAQQSVADETLSLKLAEDRYRRARTDAQEYRALGQNATSQHQMAELSGVAEDALGALTIERRKLLQTQKDSDADVDSAAKRYEAAEAKLESYHVTAPSDGVILAVNQHAGEYLSGAPALEMGDISVMYVSCQVFQGDLLKVKPGMRATITSNAFEHSLTGRVEYAGRLVQTNAQIGDVRIKLDDTQLASRLVGMEVNVKIAR